jgi:valyl-tRNA synthetase
MITSQIPIISSLVKGAREIKVVQSAEDVPAGCGTEPIAVNLAVHILVKGRINASDEIAKLEKKTALAQAGKEKLAKLAGQPNYETAIPAEVRAKNADKVSSPIYCLDCADPSSQTRELDAEIETLRLAIEKFKTLA